MLPAYAGLLLEKELRVLGNLLTNAQHPFAALLGGAKVSDKIKLINNMLDKVNILLIGGGMAATFLKAQNYAVGLSSVEEDKKELANQLIAAAKKNNVDLLLPHGRNSCRCHQRFVQVLNRSHIHGPSQ